MLTLDKLAKIGREGVQLELNSKGLLPEVARKITELVSMENLTFRWLAEQYSLEQSQGMKEVEALQLLIEQTGLIDSCRFDPFLSRGLSFYTGTVYEIFDAAGKFTSSLGGGGRYDAIVGQLVGREDIQYPAVGLSFGMESIMEMLKEREQLAALTHVLVLPVGKELTPQAINIASKLRSAGIRVRMDASGRKLKKSLASAAAKGIRFVILIGAEEAAFGQVRLKDMNEMKESLMSIEEVIRTLEV
jgi:histidyl-tRNA synthetase